jgi:hypothetical protein
LLLGSLYRRLRFGEPVVVVSGLPRSGTSMTMQMLEAGGLPVATDGIRRAGEDNPRGYYEYERVKELDKGLDRSWLRGFRGKAIKVISFLLKDLPDANNYKVLFMRRDLDEVLASQAKMLANRGESGGASDERMRRAYVEHLEAVDQLMRRRPCFDAIDVEYGDVLENPREQARRIGSFLGRRVDVERMAAAVDARLYRNRRAD